jgi:hypothetical protein
MLPLALAAMALWLAGVQANPPSPQARKVNLEQKYEAGWVIKETVSRSFEANSRIGARGKFVDQLEQSQEELEKVTEILAVGIDGNVVSARTTWTRAEETRSKREFGEAEPSTPVARKGALDGVTVLWTYDAETASWNRSMVSGPRSEVTHKELETELEKMPRFDEPLLPNEEVSVGDTWSVPAGLLKPFLKNTDERAVKEIDASCRAEQLLAAPAGELLEVAFTIELKWEMPGMIFDRPEMKKATLRGSFWFDVANSRVDSLEQRMETTWIEMRSKTADGETEYTLKLAGTETTHFRYEEARD